MRLDRDLATNTTMPQHTIKRPSTPIKKPAQTKQLLIGHISETFPEEYARKSYRLVRFTYTWRINGELQRQHGSETLHHNTKTL